MTKFLWGIFCIFVVSGCTTTLSSVEIPPPNDPAPSGLVYKLPAKRFTLKVSYEFTECDDTVDPKKPKISAIVTPELASSIEGDETASFVLDYEKLKAATKVQKLSVTLNNNGLLSAVNSDNHDKTADVIANIASSVFAIGRAAIYPRPGPGPAPGAAPAAQPQLCKYLVSKLKVKKDNEDKLLLEKQKDKDRDQTTSDIADLKTSIATIKGDIKFYNATGEKSLLSEATKYLNEENEKLKLLTENLDKLGSSKTSDIQTKIANVRSQLTFTATKSFLPSGTENTLSVPLDPEAMRTMFGDPMLDCSECPVASLEIVYTDEGSKKEKPKNGFGIAYRIPAMVTVKVKVTQSGEVAGQKKEYEALELNTPVPQLGRVASLNLQNKAFEDTSLAITFDENGGLSKLDFSSTAQAVQASAAAQSTMQGYLDFVQQRQTDKVNLTKQNLDLQKTQADTAAAVAADSNAILKGSADTANSVASDKVQTLQSLLDLQAAQSGQASADAQAILSLQRQNQLLDLQIQNAQKQQQLKSIQGGTNSQ